MSESTIPRLIKKYPNRRLYDTAISRYITLEEIRDLVLAGTEFKVVDKKTDKDITRSILLQVIAEQEEKGTPIFSTDYLSQIIRFYGDNLQSSISRYLEHSLEPFVEQQQAVKEKLKQLVGNNPIQSIREMTRQNVPLWTAIRQEILNDLTNLQRAGKSDEKPADKTTNKTTDKTATDKNN